MALGIPTLEERKENLTDDKTVNTTSSDDPFENTFFEKQKEKIREVVKDDSNDMIETGFDYVQDKIKSGEIDNPSPEDHPVETKPENSGGVSVPDVQVDLEDFTGNLSDGLDDVASSGSDLTGKATGGIMNFTEDLGEGVTQDLVEPFRNISKVVKWTAIGIGAWILFNNMEG